MKALEGARVQLPEKPSTFRFPDPAAALPASTLESKPTPPIEKITLIKILKHSPRDHMPWKILPAYFNVISGVYMYEQAAREIADAESWNDAKLQALLDAMQSAINDGSLPIHCRQTGLTTPIDAPDSLWLVTVADVNAWIEKRGGTYRWKVAMPADEVPVSQPEAAPASGPVARAAALPEQADDAGLSKCEKKIRAIEAAAAAQGYGALSIPTGGKTLLRAQCQKSNPLLFGAGPDPFEGAWRVAIACDPPRLRMANHNKFAGK